LRSKSFLEQIISDWPAKILSVAAAILMFLFYRMSTMEERFFRVPLELNVNQEYTPAENYPRSVRVTLRGSKNDIHLVMEEDIQAYLDLTPIKSEGVYRVPVEIRKVRTALQIEPLEIKVEPLEVTLKIERKVTKTLEVVPTLKGLPFHGYELVQYFINPPAIKAEGPEGLISEIQKIYTEEIDLSEKRESFTQRVSLKRENDLTVFPGGGVVEFRGIIQEAVILKTFDPVDIITIDLAPDLRIDHSLPTGTIKCQGTQILLEKLKPEQFRLVVDCSEINTAGTYTLKTRPDVPTGIFVLQFEPQEVEITLREIEE